MRVLILTTLCLLCFYSQGSEDEKVSAVIDSLHQYAAQAKFNEYFELYSAGATFFLAPTPLKPGRWRNSKIMRNRFLTVGLAGHINPGSVTFTFRPTRMSPGLMNCWITPHWV